MRLALLIAFLLPVTLMAQASPPAIHSSAFNDYYQDSTNRAVVTGQILNLPDSVDRERLLSFITVPITSFLQREIDVDVGLDGAFIFSLPGNYPVQEVLFRVKAGKATLHFGALMVGEGIDVSIDYAELLLLDDDYYNGASGIIFTGPDTELTMAGYDLLGQELNGDYSSNFFPVIMDETTDVSEKNHQFDSIYQEILALYKVQLEGYSSETADYILNDWKTDYLSMVNLNYWDETMPDAFLEKYLSHTPLAMSNPTKSFYRHFSIALQAQAERLAKTPGDSSLTEGQKLRNQLTALNRLVADFDPARGDLVYLFHEDTRPGNEMICLENALEHVTTPWVKDLLQKRYKEVAEEMRTLEAATNKITPLTQPADLGEAVGTLPFGADLYAVGDDLTGEELLTKLRGAFAGNALYLDFWAVWCQPCLGEMPHSSRVHGEAEGLPLDFVYLCTDSGGDQEQWKNLIAKHKVPGIHLFVPDNVHSQLLELFSGRGYPTYVLLKDDGTPVLDVKRPSGLNRAELEQMIGE